MCRDIPLTRPRRTSRRWLVLPITAPGLPGWTDEQSISVYLHVPYCREICLYCGCNTKMAVRDDVISTISPCTRSRDRAGRGLIGKPPGIARLHWGGGTPSILGLEGLKSVLTALGSHFRFDASFEHAIELDPRYVTAEFASGLAELGATRASLGVQDVNPLVQLAIGRIQPLSVVESAVDRLRSAGIRNLNFDLIYGLPMQTLESIRETCALVAPWGRIESPASATPTCPVSRPTNGALTRQLCRSSTNGSTRPSLLAEELVRFGYVRIGIDHFAKPADSLVFSRRIGKTAPQLSGLYRRRQADPAWALGPLRFRPSPTDSSRTSPMCRNTSMPSKPAASRPRAVAGSTQTICGARAVIERLMCDFSVDLCRCRTWCRFQRRTLDAGSHDRRSVSLEIQGTKLVVTEAGRPVVRVVAAAFDTCRRPQTAQFSKAV